MKSLALALVLVIAVAIAAPDDFPSSKSTPGPDCGSMSSCETCLELHHCVWCGDGKCLDHDTNALEGICPTATRQCNATKAADPKENRYKFPDPKIMGRADHGSSEVVGSTGDIVEADVVGAASAPHVLKEDKKEKKERKAKKMEVASGKKHKKAKRIRLAVKMAYTYKGKGLKKLCKKKFVVRAIRKALKARRLAKPQSKKVKACDLLRIAFRMIKVCKKKISATASKEERARILKDAASKIVAKLLNKKQKKVADAVKAAILDSKTVKVPSAIKREIVKDIMKVAKQEKKEGLKVPTKKLVAVTKKVLKQLKKNPNTTKAEIKVVVKKEMDKKAAPALPKPANKKEKKLVKEVKSDVKAAIAAVRGVKVPAAVKAEIIKDVIAVKMADKAAGLKISGPKVVKAVAKAIKKMKKSPELTKEDIRAVLKKELDKKVEPKIKAATKEDKKILKQAKIEVKAAIAAVKSVKVTGPVKAELVKDVAKEIKKQQAVSGKKPKVSRVIKAVKKALRKMKKTPNVSKSDIKAVLKKEISKKTAPPAMQNPTKLVVHDAVKAAVARVEATKKVALSRKEKKAIKKAVKQAIKIEKAQGVNLKPKAVMSAAKKVAKEIAKAKITGIPPKKDLVTVAVKKAEKKTNPARIMMRAALKAVRAQKVLRGEPETKGAVKRISRVMKAVVKSNIRDMKASHACTILEALFDIGRRTQDDDTLIQLGRSALQGMLDPKRKAALDAVKMVNAERRAVGQRTLSPSTKIEVSKIVAESLTDRQILKGRILAAVAKKTITALERRPGDNNFVEAAASQAAAAFN